METVILSPSLHNSTDVIQSADPAHAPSKRNRLASFSSSRDSGIFWGRRHHHGSWLHSLGCLGIMLLCPCLVIFCWISLSSFNGSFTAAGNFMWQFCPLAFFSSYAPRPDLKVSLWYCGWILFQITLFQYLPAKLSKGQLTPAGHLLRYRTNGLLAWVITQSLFVGLVMFGHLDPAVIANNWEPLLVIANVSGFVLSGVAYAKARMSPTHEGDSKFSGSVLYDIYMGVELNPRVGKYFDFKLFTNGRPGIVAWTLIDLSFIALQYQLHGYVSNSIIIATLLHGLYVVDFFVNEDWYLRTIDICHDHFGFYLAWGSLVWLPAVYTLQAQYLARNPINLSNLQAFAIVSLGVGGYILFRSVNHQKDLVRRTDGNCQLWGSTAKVIRVKYRTKDGSWHDSILLCSGWWGLARHVNYMGDLILSYSMCATCGLNNLLPWTYAIFMTTLLIHRCWRDEERCSKKYGKGWEEYRRKVKWVIIPGIY